MARLRAPGGCPWDREQTFDSIKPFTLEEAYEVLEAIDNRDWDELEGELGDLLLQVLFYAEMSQEEGRFGIDDVLERLSTKLVNRHPHVFGDVKAETAGDVLRNWEAIKAEEKKKRLENTHPSPKPGERVGHPAEENPQPGQTQARPGHTADAEPINESVLAGVSSRVPALMEAFKLSSRAAHVGFEWPEIGGLFEKLHEETEELRQELKEYPAPGPRPPQRGVAGASGLHIPEELRARLEDEVGDLLFVLVNVARYLCLDPESALRKTNRKFRRRFQWMEERMRERGRKLPEATLEEMESVWQESKQQERTP